jgi:multicomponent K+:H+ antiporter subunit A
MFLHRRRITAILFMSVVGLVLSLTFVHFSAPDLALTQISVEVVTVVLLLLALHLLPKETPVESSMGRKVRDGVLASAAGAGIAALTWIMLTRPVETISAYHLEQSYPLGGGTNVVNVILVDFRGFDTFGEITVLGIAALGIYALLDGLGIPARWRASALDDEGAHPILMVVIARLLLPLALMVGLYLFLRGHAQPGGGFIAGLVVAVALILQYVASGIGATQDRMKLNFHPMIAAGILVAGLTGIGAWLWGYSFLKSWYGYFEILGLSEFELASAALFDVGVFLTVVGAVMLALVNMGKLPEAESVVRVNGTGKRGGLDHGSTGCHRGGRPHRVRDLPDAPGEDLPRHPGALAPLVRREPLPGVLRSDHRGGLVHHHLWTGHLP